MIRFTSANHVLYRTAALRRSCDRRVVVEPGSLADYAVRYLIIIALAVLATAGCSRTPTFAAQIQAAGGEAALKRECQSIFEEHQKTQTEFVESALPPAIAIFKPQVVEVRSDDGFPMVDIQTSGGFSHRGLLVVLTNTRPDFLPRKSSWRVTKIGDGVFEYHE